MVKKIDLQGVIEGLTQEVAEQLIDSDEARELPLVVIENARARCTEMRMVRFNPREMASITALISWAANKNNIPETVVSALVADRYERVLVEDIPAEHYPRVVEYLVDFKTSIN